MKNEAMKLALDLAIMHHTDEGYYELRSKVRVAAKEALAKQEQVEPVAFITPLMESQMFDDWCPYKGNPDPRVVWAAAIEAVNGLLLGATPQQQRKPLTMFDTEKLAKQCGVEWTTRIDKLCKLASSHSTKE